MRITHFSLNFNPGYQSRDTVNDNNVNSAAPDQRFAVTHQFVGRIGNPTPQAAELNRQ